MNSKSILSCLCTSSFVCQHTQKVPAQQILSNLSKILFLQDSLENIYCLETLDLQPRKPSNFLNIHISSSYREKGDNFPLCHFLDTHKNSICCHRVFCCVLTCDRHALFVCLFECMSSRRKKMGIPLLGIFPKVRDLH